MSGAPRDATAFEVRDALTEPGCAVCRLSLRAVSRAIGSIAYEQVNDLHIREQLRRAGGFCNAHAHQWLREARTVLGTALIYRDVLNASLAELDAPSATGKRGRLLRGLRGGQPDGRCPACEVQADAESRYLQALLAIVAAEPQTLATCDGVCRRHALAALRSGGPGAAPLVEHTRQCVERMLVELDEVIRKEDYRFRHEPRTDAERSVPGRAIGWSAGLDGLVSG